MGIFSKLFSGKSNKENQLNKESDVYFKAGEAYFKKSDYLNSKKFFEKALDIFPNHQNAIRNLEVVNNKIKIVNSNKEKDKRHNDGIGFEERNLNPRESSSVLNTVKSDVANVKEEDINYYYNFFNISRNYSNDEIKEVLSKEFRNWRTKINSPDPKKKYEAEDMLNKIAKARKILLK